MGTESTKCKGLHCSRPAQWQWLSREGVGVGGAKGKEAVGEAGAQASVRERCFHSESWAASGSLRSQAAPPVPNL